MITLVPLACIILFLGMINLVAHAQYIGNITVGIQTYVACVWSANMSVIDFGVELTPGQVYNATGNYAGSYDWTLYNVTVSLASNVEANFTLYGMDLVRTVPTIAVIGIGNVTWWYNMTEGNSTSLIYANSQPVPTAETTILGFVPVGDTAHVRWWLGIPTGQEAGDYQGNYTWGCISSV